MATCNTPIGRGVMSFLCELPPGHEGPHKAQGNDRSLRERAAWEQAQETLRQTQGKPLTMADRTEGGETGTPPPGFFPCRYHQVIHHQDVRSDKCMAWSGPHDGPQPRTIQRLPSTMGDVTRFEPLPDMPGDQERAARVFREEGTSLTEVVEAIDKTMADSDNEKQPTDSATGVEAVSPTGGAVVDTAEGKPYQASPDQYAKTHDRPEDQPMPTPNDRKTAHAILIEMVQGRLDLGIQRYGTGLQPFNGRDAALDALEELVDLGVYLITHREERNELLGLLAELRPMVGMSLRGNEIIDRFQSYLQGNAI